MYTTYNNILKSLVWILSSLPKFELKMSMKKIPAMYV